MNFDLPFEQVLGDSELSILDKSSDETRVSSTRPEGRSSSEGYSFSSPEFMEGDNDALMHEFFNFDETVDSNVPSFIKPPSVFQVSSPYSLHTRDESEVQFRGLDDSFKILKQPGVDMIYENNILPGGQNLKQTTLNPSHMNLNNGSLKDGTTLGPAVKSEYSPVSAALSSTLLSPTRNIGETTDPVSLTHEVPVSSVPLQLPPQSNLSFSVDHLPAQNEQKWRSRVETNMLFELRVNTLNGPVSFDYIRLPSWAHREDKKRAFKLQLQVKPDSYLQLVPTVMVADRKAVVQTCCTRCLLRERKRNARSQPDKEKTMQAYNKLKAKERMLTDAPQEVKRQLQMDMLNLFPPLDDIDEDRMIMVFTGPEYVPLSPVGANSKMAQIYARVTCYSSHQSCPYFNIYWGLYDCNDNLVGHVLFPEPVTVLDDHKSRLQVRGDKHQTPTNNARVSDANSKSIKQQNVFPDYAQMAPTDFDQFSGSYYPEKRRRGYVESNVPMSATCIPATTNPGLISSRSSSTMSNMSLNPSLSAAPFQQHLHHISSDRDEHRPYNNHHTVVITGNRNSVNVPSDQALLNEAKAPFYTDSKLQTPVSQNAIRDGLDPQLKMAPSMGSVGPILPEMNSTYQALNQQTQGASPPPIISRIIPNRGSILGGYEVTVLGANFANGLVCVFGNTPATSTYSWSDSTIVATCPPASVPGPVKVSFQNDTLQDTNQNDVIFTYDDDLDHELYKLTLQVIGLKLTGSIQNPLTLSKRLLRSWRDEFAGFISNSLHGTQNTTHSVAQDSDDSSSSKVAIRKMLKSHKLPYSDDLEGTVFSSLNITYETEGLSASELSAENELGRSLLHMSSARGLTKVVFFLLTHGVDVNKGDSLGYTPLHYSVLFNNPEVTTILLEHDADADLLTNNGFSALELANASTKKIFLDLFESIEKSTFIDASAGADKLKSEALCDSRDSENTAFTSATEAQPDASLKSREMPKAFGFLPYDPETVSQLKDVPAMMHKAFISKLKSISLIPDEDPPPYSESVAKSEGASGSSTDSAAQSKTHDTSSVWWSLKWQSRLVGRGKMSALTPDEEQVVREQAKKLKKGVKQQ
ncbi:IPT/TIG ankyrin repeat protein [Schizosaccharomyces japonicus yFS275]|uniref:IPT/TIG ankyrin repeat protein n=1 Tax=Schizosaccharomyces japonicus (strain yFS275 / FY16936) TaxID=402676 RepID=B6K1T4_SCHJY|nr:IPT/TIG ankyrin repeat protein [Schizosaccharomyces japonicus yFS275]EEB07115.1 IPT/TIG ankyrin repeat protein [Schizosaccharomyces japonicus yFS275]